MGTIIRETSLAQKQISYIDLNEIKLAYIAFRLFAEEFGIDVVEGMSSYRYHALLADRAGQYSVSISPSWRVIYKKKNNKLEVITILEVTDHKY